MLIRRRAPASDRAVILDYAGVRRTGGNLSEALANLSTVLRERKKMLGKIAAMSAEAKASGAMIDLATGRVALVASADASRGRVASSATQVSGEIDVMREARDEVLAKLAAQVIKQCREVRQAQGAGV